MRIDRHAYSSPRQGIHISPWQLIRALHDGYNLSYPFAAFLTMGGFAMLGQFSDMSEDTQEGQEYAPCDCNGKMLETLCSFSSDGKHLTAFDLARARVSREHEYKQRLDGVHSEIARGEVALVLGIFGGPEQKVPLNTLRQWFREETFPKGWEPEHSQTFLKTVHTAWTIRSLMNMIERK
ncbi:hypothetical protein NEOLEDRAFT_1136895 [Neolentinus lepideus HHB14362 ss-1]|uniref:Heme haloperoxidase family profile domain-containing protein n=1 Tax=Neolentinus lepideus HHB14362 ss-1 TaxID=1314782 RepID=A0A165R3E8_9AGAM|nr:hypothetical protein NEOLEDRAFT_1136895 [Neolentinus lepideus HHB14362 ss-1]